MNQSTQTIEFSPFVPEDLGSAWRTLFGRWEVAGGRLCQIVPGAAGGEVEPAISGTPGMEKLRFDGVAQYLFAGAGFQRVRLSFEVSLRRRDTFAVALDEWAAEWRPENGMTGGLAQWEDGSKLHAYDQRILPTEPGVVSRIEVIADEEQVQFVLDGRPMFTAQRAFRRPSRKIELKTRAGACIGKLRIEVEGPVPERKSARRDSHPLLSACVDFADDILYAPYTSSMLDLLVGKLDDLGVRRIYWINHYRVRREAVGEGADPVLRRNIDAWRDCENFKTPHALATIHNCFPFLPKVCAAAHKRGMEVYAILKPFEMGFHPSRGNPSPYPTDHFCNTHPDAMMARWSAPESSGMPDPDAPVASIRFYKDDDRPHAVSAGQIAVWVSDDNKRYHRWDRPLHVGMGVEQRRFARYWEGGLEEPRAVQVIRIDGLEINQPYFAVTVSGSRYTFRNRMYRLAEALDERGRAIPLQRNLPEFPRGDGAAWDGRGGFVFKGFTTPRSPTGCWRGADWIELFQTLDGSELGFAFRRGAPEPFVRGTPSPAHPAVHRFWTDWLNETLDDGVDGIDLRIEHHQNILDWANCGFGTLVESAFQERFGRTLRPELACRRQHMQLLGEMYSGFVRSASRITRGRGKRFQHHVSVGMDSPPGRRAMTNIYWDWRSWVREGLLDAVTLKNMSPASTLFDEVMEVADGAGLETIWCPYLNCILGMSDSWQQQMSDVMRDVVDRGLRGIMLYEVASFLQPSAAGDVVLKFPELGPLLAPYAAARS